MSFWKNDNFFVGVTAGLTLTVVTALIIILAAPFFYRLLNLGIPDIKVIMLAFFPPVLLMRYYMRKLKFSKSGSGVIVIVFAGIILYFTLVAGNYYTLPSF